MEPSTNDTPSTVTSGSTARPLSYLDDYLHLRQSIIDSLLKLDGQLGSHVCHKCAIDKGIYRCEMCLYPELYCGGCIVKRHVRSPFHRLLHWDGNTFVDCSLQLLQAVLWLGHNGAQCPNTTDTVKDFVVIDVSGIHLKTVAFCGCYKKGMPHHRRDQLLHHKLFPTTLKVPQAAFTFDVLESFHLLTLQSKIAAYDFYCALEHKTDNAGVKNLPDYYEQFLDVICVYHNLMAAKRSSRAHDPAGIKATAPGECAVECPACPHPSNNLPEGWEVVTDRRWLYSLILTMDTNFRLKNWDRYVWNDVSLSDGWGHWVPSAPFLKHIEAHNQDLEPNLCDSQWRAINQADTKRSSGYASTGIGGVVCGRHGLVRRNGFGDLQKGEWYANMDFILFQTLAGVIFQRLLLSYSIVCQYSRNLFTRMKELPEQLQLPNNATKLVDFIIPKFHLFGHGKDPEQWWAHINPVSMSTKLMTPWACRETIDDHARGWNWHKITQLGTSLSKALQEAIEMSARHMSLHTKFTASFPSDITEIWEHEVIAWEGDHNKPNPFDNDEAKCTSRHSSCPLILIYFEEDNMAAAYISPFHLRWRADNSSSHRPARIKECPSSSDCCMFSNDKPETIPLFLPSEVGHFVPAGSLSQTAATWKIPGSFTAILPLRAKEMRLCIGQANNTLIELRRLLRITMGMWDFKFTDVGFSQRGNTQARSTINRFQEKVRRTAEHYRAARKALLTLDPMSTSLTSLRPLKQSDTQCPQRQEQTAVPGERSEGVEQPFEDIQPVTEADITNSEWARSRARAARWTEEKELVLEEMRRVLAFLRTRAVWWEQQQLRRADSVSVTVLDGLRAYAIKQAGIVRLLHCRFASLWHPRMESYRLSADWFSDGDLACHETSDALTNVTPKPGNLHLGGLEIQNVLEGLIKNKGIQRLAGFAASGFAMYAPRTYNCYNRMMEALLASHSDL
ncbi:hypothetical protein BDN71DRAFT_1510941 [Pleurotus eryngii]|uniref:CxC2-like cysteine cluster KDZ transposase-associated domain-containing protein n=1 Tax=Pleurotus eryngii TaxID=5323 RepID=A0A9P6DCL1_PLEER|nr:hypothetical protein BDN71DRAFT_1510941 [Pleurotus eryngii]